MEVDSAYTLIAHAIDVGQAAAGYLIVGDIKENASELAEKILKKLGLSLDHVDVVKLEPSGKKRIIKVDDVRTLVEAMGNTAFSGGWKVGIIYGADRLEAAGANTFLKTLEEPTPKTMFLLLTDAPEGILPTIISRTQRVDLEVTGDYLPPEIVEDIVVGVRKMDAGLLTGILTGIVEDAEDADVAVLRKAFFKIVQEAIWHENKELYKRVRHVQAVEDAFHQCEKSMNMEAVISLMCDRFNT